MHIELLKWQWYEIFWKFFHESMTSDKQVKIVFPKNYFSQRHSNFKFKKFDSTQACKDKNDAGKTLRSVHLRGV